MLDRRLVVGASRPARNLAQNVNPTMISTGSAGILAAPWTSLGQQKMGLLFWKNNKAIDGFAEAIADDLFSFVQPAAAKQQILGKGDLPKKQARKVDQKMTDVVLQIQRFIASHSLGVYGKARLQMKFNDRLKELGYDAAVVDKIAEFILLRNP